MDGTNKVVYLEEYRLKLTQKESEEKKEIESVKKEVKEEVDIALQKRESGKLLPLVRTLTFRGSGIDICDYLTRITELLRGIGVNDMRIYKEDGTEILDPKDAVGERTLTFSDEASIALLNFLSNNGYRYKITKDKALVIFGKKY